jgi:26S proteasome regulatory subunit N10
MSSLAFSHLVTIPPGPHILSDVLITSPILAGEDGAPPGFASGAGFEFGVDPNLDPELALALRISMEEERARQEASTGSSGSGTAESAGASMAVDSGAGASGSSDDDELARALMMSMGKEDGDVQMDVSEEDEEIARAIALSMQGEGGSSSTVSLDTIAKFLSRRSLFNASFTVPCSSSTLRIERRLIQHAGNVAWS